jgi:putative tricarboxylic transport membrane protein
MFRFVRKSHCLSGLLALVLGAASAYGAEPERLHLLIPAGPGGGLDSTARAIGSALRSEAIRAPVSYENMTGGGGGRALGHFVETAKRQQQTLLINSTPLIVRSLQGLFPQSYRDVVPIAGLVAEFNVFVVRADSRLTSWQQVLDGIRENPRNITSGGGSVRGSMDHIVLAQALEAAQLDPRRARYLPYDGGGKAMIALLGGEVDLLSTGAGEVLGYVDSGEVRTLAVAADKRLPQLPDVPTLSELGTPVVFANWRGLFAPPGTDADTVAELTEQITRATSSAAWDASLTRYGWLRLDLYGSEFLNYLQQQERDLKIILQRLGFIR